MCRSLRSLWPPLAILLHQLDEETARAGAQRHGKSNFCGAWRPPTRQPSTWLPAQPALSPWEAPARCCPGCTGACRVPLSLPPPPSSAQGAALTPATTTSTLGLCRQKGVSEQLERTGRADRGPCLATGWGKPLCSIWDGRGCQGDANGCVGATFTSRAAHPGWRSFSARPTDRRHKQVFQRCLQLTGAANEVGHVLNL